MLNPTNIRLNKVMRRILLIVAALVSVAGCGGEPDMAQVTGEVLTKDGQPCEGALVVFHPQSEAQVNDPKPVATTDSNGRFALTTHELNDGALPGEYGVTVVWNKAESEGKMSLTGEGGGVTDQLQGRYGDPRNPKLTATVVPGGPNEFKFQVN